MKYIAKKNSTILEFLKTHYAGMSNSGYKNFFKHKRIQINGLVCSDETYSIKTGDEILILKEGETKKIKLPFDLIYEDNDILVVNKPAGILSSGEGITKKPTLHKLVDQYLQQKTKGKKHAHVVHRLDKEVSGLILFATSEKIVEFLQTNWKKFTKKYLALTRHNPPQPSGTITTWLIEKNLKMFVIQKEQPNAVHAITHYKWLRFERKNSLIEVTLETGKKNQIRVHLSHIGCPIIGDEKYGDTQKGNIKLLSHFLEIQHPTSGKKVSWTLEPDRKFFL